MPQSGVDVDEVSERVRRRVRKDFPHQAEQVIEALAGLTEGVFSGEPRDSIAVERIQVAALVRAHGRLRKLDEAVALGRRDWRDLLVGAGLAHEGWQQLVENELAPPPSGHAWLARRRR
ncbi:hypothetical protein [Actinomadura sp. 9N215]|uniref:hypothetical protein n=1 Tax=Actinomadura sp. 9N215 TaxID=3375150 RepID=UPI0037A8335D